MSAHGRGPQMSTAEPVVLARRGGLAITVVPAHGARITQIADPRGNNWLADTGASELPDGAPVEFAGGTRGGWDECLPSVSACADPNRPGVDIADHGDFWAAPWTVHQLDDDSVTLVGDVPGHPLQVRKTVGLPADRESVQVDIDIRNRADRPYQFLYSAHPLWAFEHDVVVDLPGAGETVPGFGLPDVLPDVSRIAYRGERTNYKVFIRWSGRARYSVPALNSAVSLRQSPEINRWLGVCVNRGAYPNLSAGDHWVALEPTTAPTDSLAAAVQSGSAAVLQPGGSVRWTTDIEVVHGEAMR